MQSAQNYIMSYADIVKRNIPVFTETENIYSRAAPENVNDEQGEPERERNYRPSHNSDKNYNVCSRNDRFVEPRQPQRQSNEKNHSKIYHVDTGVNLSHKNYSGKITRVLRDAVSYNCRRCIVISTSVIDSERVTKLVREHNQVANGEYKLFCTIGVHPHEAERALKNPSWIAELEKMIEQNRDVVVAVGECGLDYDRMFSDKSSQLQVFRAQIELAKKMNLPLYLHERKAKDDFVKMLTEYDNLRGVVHCFTSDSQTAKTYLDMGFYLGITGWICDDSKNEQLLDALNNVIPIDKILMETDAPYLTPKDLERKPFHNGPQFIPHISSRVAHVKNIRRDELSLQVLRNVKTLFGPIFD